MSILKVTGVRRLEIMSRRRIEAGFNYASSFSLKEANTSSLIVESPPPCNNRAPQKSPLSFQIPNNTCLPKAQILRAAQLLAYNGAVIERKASEYPVSNPYNLRSGRGWMAPPADYENLVVLLKNKLIAWVPKVEAAYQRHLESGASIQNEQEDALWRAYTGEYQAIMQAMDAKFQRMEEYIRPDNYTAIRDTNNNNLTDILFKLLFDDLAPLVVQIRSPLLKQAIGA
jgi:hypothetical protein